MYHLFNKIRPFPVGWIAQPSLFVFIYVIVSYLCTISICEPNFLTPNKIEKILHLCIFTNKNTVIVQDKSHGHAILQNQNVQLNMKEKNDSREEMRLKKEVPRIKPHSPSSSWCKSFYFLSV